MQVVEREFSVNGYRLCAREWHRGAAHPVLACHGWLDNAASFDRLAAAMPECHLVALDLAGHGLSDHKSPQAHYHLWDDLLDILAVADSLGWSQFHLLGHSRGALMSTLLAAAMPERLLSLCLLDGLVPQPVVAGDAAAQLRQFLLDQRRERSKPPSLYASLDQAVAVRCRAAGMSEEAARPIVARGLEMVEGGYRWRSDPRLRLASAFKLTEEHNRALLEALSCPGLLIAAEGGLGAYQALAEQASAASGLTVERVAGSHHCHLEAGAEDIAKRLVAFIAAAGRP